MLIAGALLAAGCGSSESGQPQAGPNEATSTAGGTTATSQTTTAPPAGTTPPASKPLPPPPSGGNQADVPPALLDQVRADAAQRAGVTPADVRIVASTAQTWNDGSLGCPRPGEYYIQVMVEGFQIFAEAAGRRFDYRTSQSAIKLCEK